MRRSQNHYRVESTSGGCPVGSSKPLTGLEDTKHRKFRSPPRPQTEIFADAIDMVACGLDKKDANRISGGDLDPSCAAEACAGAMLQSQPQPGDHGSIYEMQKALANRGFDAKKGEDA